MAAVSAIFAAFSVSGLMVFVGLVTVAAIEFTGRAKLKRLEAAGPRRLFWNQWLIAGLGVLYCGYQIFAAFHGGGMLADVMAADPAAAEILGDLPELIRTITVWVYGIVMGCMLIYQSLMAFYYKRLGQHLATYQQQTPEWITHAQAA